MLVQIPVSAIQRGLKLVVATYNLLLRMILLSLNLIQLQHLRKLLNHKAIEIYNHYPKSELDVPLGS
jgi:hypothetical protein